MLTSSRYVLNSAWPVIHSTPTPVGKSSPNSKQCIRHTHTHTQFKKNSSLQVFDSSVEILVTNCMILNLHGTYLTNSVLNIRLSIIYSRDFDMLEKSPSCCSLDDIYYLPNHGHDRTFLDRKQISVYRMKDRYWRTNKMGAFHVDVGLLAGLLLSSINTKTRQQQGSTYQPVPSTSSFSPAN